MATHYGEKGISYPASKDNSADANTLDDYEQGAWSPVVPNYNQRHGGYTIIGSQFTGWFSFSIGNAGQATTMSGLPYGHYGDVYGQGASVYGCHFTGNFGSSRWGNMNSNGGTNVSFEDFSYNTVAVPANKFGSGWFSFENSAN